MAKKPTRKAPPPRWRKNFIQEWRKDRGLTQQQLADLAGYTKATISRIESGDIAYTRENLEAIAQALGTHPGLLLIRPPEKADALPTSKRA
jgi:transcriptional regulator with XRE-family HTH domain